MLIAAKIAFNANKKYGKGPQTRKRNRLTCEADKDPKRPIHDTNEIRVLRTFVGKICGV